MSDDDNGLMDRRQPAVWWCDEAVGTSPRSRVADRAAGNAKWADGERCPK
jgi:hypothetical protein